jgi:hypothetical protein
MKQRLAHVSVHQTAKVLAMVYGLLGVLLIPLLWLASLSDPEGAVPIQIAIFFPLIYAFFGYIFTVIGAVTYNAIASRFGGIEFTLGGGPGDTAWSGDQGVR